MTVSLERGKKLLSVCIPVYRQKVTVLVKQLHALSASFREEMEILVVDDGSPENWRRRNRGVRDYLDGYVELDRNMGRAAVRNRFLEYARGEFLLFIDGDSSVPDGKFFDRYRPWLEEGKERVIVGGSSYRRERPPRSRRLRWRYGWRRESLPAAVRSQNPWSSFKTNNVIIPAEVLRKIPFEEALRGYGHEDTFMGYRLWQAGVEVIHIDNPVFNEELDANGVFLRKSAEAVRSLFQVLALVEGDPHLVEQVRLLSWTGRLVRQGRARRVERVLTPLKPLIEAVLKSGIPLLRLLDLYKLEEALKVCRQGGYCHYFFDEDAVQGGRPSQEA